MNRAVGTSGLATASVRRTLLFTAVYAVPVIAAVTPVIDLDIWWHLRTGQWIVQHGAVPTTDPFSIAGAGQPWVAYSWLFDLLAYGLFRVAGLAGLVAYTTFMALLIVAALHMAIRAYRLPLLEEAVLLFLAAFGMRTLLSPRPWFFSIFFTIVELILIMRARRTGAAGALWILPLVFALWANLHPQFIYGLFLLAVASFEAWVTARRDGRVALETNAVPLGRWMAILAACALGTLATPYHVRLHETIGGLIAQSGVFSVVMELSAMRFRAVEDWIVLALALGSAFALGRSRTLRIFPALLLATGVAIAFRASRDVWLLDAAAVIVIASTRDGRPRIEEFSFNVARVVMIGLGTMCVIAVAALGNATPRALSAAVAQTFPEGAVAFVKNQRYEGPLYNHLDWGGYLIWRLPALPVSMDGRTNIHGDARIARSMATWNGEPEWASDPELARARVVIAGKRFALTSLLRLDPRFHAVYDDDVATVFVANR